MEGTERAPAETIEKEEGKGKTAPETFLEVEGRMEKVTRTEESITTPGKRDRRTVTLTSRWKTC